MIIFSHNFCIAFFTLYRTNNNEYLFMMYIYNYLFIYGYKNIVLNSNNILLFKFK